MRELNLIEMVQIEGSISCSGGWGMTLGFAVGGLLVVALTGGAALAMGVMAGTYLSGLGAVYNCFG